MLNNLSKSKYEYAFLAATLVIFFSYAQAGVAIHFFNHLFPAIAVGFLVLIMLEKKGMATRNFRLGLPFLIWIYSIIPELFVEEGGLHPIWTNIFLFHEWFDHLLEASPTVLILNGLLALSASSYYFLFAKK